MLLAGDIGGTKTDLAIFDVERETATPIVQREFPSGRYPSLQAIVEEFLRDANVQAKWACFAVAGPVVDGAAKITNLPWILHEGALRRELHLETVHLLNDLEAIAWAVPTLRPESLHALNQGSAVHGGNIAVIAPGTGLGEAFLSWDGTGYRAHASEGGHADFAPLDEFQAGLLRHLWKSFDHVSYETVCSGIGIPHLYEYVRQARGLEEVADITARLSATTDRTPILVAAGVANPPQSALCRETIDLFVSILAAEAGNLAMKVLATGGVYLAGGLPLHVLPRLDGKRFMHTFARKGRFNSLLVDVPVHVVRHRTALLGAARAARALEGITESRPVSA